MPRTGDVDGDLEMFTRPNLVSHQEQGKLYKMDELALNELLGAAGVISHAGMVERLGVPLGCPMILTFPSDSFDASAADRKTVHW